MVGPLVTLTTDFGSGSVYVAQLKGQLLSTIPNVRLVDLSHELPPQDVAQAALFWSECVDWYPPVTIHLAVVDPGVGTTRRMLCVRSAGQFFVAPDNGLLAYILRRRPASEVREIDLSAFDAGSISATFQGRDVMAPVVGWIAQGVEFAQFSRPTDHWTDLEWPEPIQGDREIHGCILSIDRFGNLISNITTAHLAQIPAATCPTISCGGAVLNGLRRTYGEQAPGTLVALVGSGGRLEIAMVNGHAARLLAADVGHAIQVRWC